jgi:phosphinothricin acetyltransferase
MLRECTEHDARRIADIYNYYVKNTIITFEEEPVMPATMLQRILDIMAVYPWLVYEEDGDIVGYAYADRWKSRCAYRHAVETSIYLDMTNRGQGIGTCLYSALLDSLKALSVHSIIGGIALPNTASVALHEKFGFEKVAHFKEVGWKFNAWVDVGYWELLLDPHG